MQEVIYELEQVLNEGAKLCDAPFRLRLYRDVQYLDKLETSSDKEIVQCLVSSPQGTYLPIPGVDLEQSTCMVTILLPLRLKPAFDEVILRVRERLVGRFTESGDKFLITNMDAPICANLDYRSLEQFSAADGRFHFNTEEYAQIQLQIYLLRGSGVYVGNDLVLNLDGTELKVINAMLNYGNEFQAVQRRAENTMRAIPGKSQLTITCSVVFEQCETLTNLLVETCNSRIKAHRLTVSLKNIKLLEEEPVILTQCNFEYNKGSIAGLNLVFMKGA